MDLSMLNPEQRKAAETLDGPVLILAGAGSGKTRTLTYRVANLIDHGVKPWHILALTFTNKAANEMKKRILELVGEDAQDAWISTFHSSCARILRRDIEKIGYERSFAIFDDDDQNSLFKELYKRENIDEKYLPVKEVKAKISDAKDKLWKPDDWFAHSDKSYRDQKIHDLYVAYEDRKQQLNALDFDDLLVKTLELLADHPPVLQAYQERFQYILVDEYQDTNRAQYELIRLLTVNHHNLCVVGDDDQSIYSWRGADIRNILNFEKDFPETVVIRLEQNYRSTQNILDAANQVIAHNAQRKDKKLWTESEAGEKIQLFCAEDDRGEAAWVTNRIRDLVRQGQDYGEIAVLYRTNNQSRVLEELLTNSSIPYSVFGGMKFYDRKEVRDLIAYMRILVNPSDDLSLKRIINVPRRSIGDSTVQVLEDHAHAEGMPLYSAIMAPPESLASRPRKCVNEFAELLNQLQICKETMKLSEFVVQLVELTGLRKQYEGQDNEDAKSRVDNIDEIINAVAAFEKSNPEGKLEDYLESVALVSDLDKADTFTGRVTLMTIHSAKGLEFNNVFIVGLEENLFPFHRNADTEEKVEEERRLFYVALTRARQRLFLSRSSTRMIYTQQTRNEPSRFLSEIPARLLADDLANKRARAFGSDPAPVRQSGVRQPRPMKSPSDPLGLGSLNIPGVRKGFVGSAARGLEPKNAEHFEVGDRVMHKKFGEGIVEEMIGSGADARIRIEFSAFGVKEFNLAIVPLIKLED